MQYSNKDYNELLHDRFKALSVKQPYAGLIASGKKKIEVRSRPTKYRGQLLICASKDGQPSPSALSYGCTLAFVDLYDCKPLSELTEEEWQQTMLLPDTMAIVKSLRKGYAWMLRDARPVIEFPVRGQLGIFNLVYTKGVIMEYPTHLKTPVTY